MFDYLKDKRDIEIIFGGADEKLHKIYSKALTTPSVKKLLDANNIEFMKNSELFGIPIFSLYKS
jgi:CTP:phosphocholine cytidylyltransferase-like protein